MGVREMSAYQSDWSYCSYAAPGVPPWQGQYQALPAPSPHSMVHPPMHYWDGDNLVDAYGRVIKRRTSANKKERRRTQSINNAFAELRECIPNVPADTKLSKIKTLRLATSYIAYLMEVLRSEDAPPEGFKADVTNTRNQRNSSEKEDSDMETEGTIGAGDSLLSNSSYSSSSSTASITPEKKPAGRTGWPETVWAQELKN